MSRPQFVLFSSQNETKEGSMPDCRDMKVAWRIVVHDSS